MSEQAPQVHRNINSREHRSVKCIITKKEKKKKMDANYYDLQILDTFQFGLQTSINNAIAEHRCVKLIYSSCVLSLTECGFKVHTDVNSPK